MDSWIMFYRHPVFFAGIALSSTYMTVLALHNGMSIWLNLWMHIFVYSWELWAQQHTIILLLGNCLFHPSYLWVRASAVRPWVGPRSPCSFLGHCWDHRQHHVSLPQEEVECDKVRHLVCLVTLLLDGSFLQKPALKCLNTYIMQDWCSWIHIAGCDIHPDGYIHLRTGVTIWARPWGR